MPDNNKRVKMEEEKKPNEPAVATATSPAPSQAQQQHPWDQFRALKEEAYLYIDQALRLEETNRSDRALIMYERGLDHLDRALDLPIDLPGSLREDLDKLHKMRTKMLRTRQEIVFRMRELQSSAEAATDAREAATAISASADADGGAPPPTYEQATGAVPSNALILFYIPDEVNIFYINAKGQVTRPYPPSSLYLYKFSDEQDVAETAAPAFLQVGTWVYPLVPGRSPVLQSRSGSFMFPDLDESISGNAVGLILPPQVTEDQRAGFESLLNQLTSLVQKENLSDYDEYIRVSGQVAEGMTQGAEVVGKGLVKASIKGAELMKKGTSMLKENMAPAAEAVAVDPKVKTGLEAASWTAEKAVKVSGFLVSKAGQATVALGRFLAPHIQTGGAKALSHFVEQSEEKSSKQLKIASEVASGSISAISTVYMALENSSKILAKNIAENTVEVVKHKYGHEVGNVTDNALAAAGNTYLAVYNAGALGPKGLAKRLAKDTGKVTVGVPDTVLQGQIDLDVPQPGPVNDAKVQKSAAVAECPQTVEADVSSPQKAPEKQPKPAAKSEPKPDHDALANGDEADSADKEPEDDEGSKQKLQGSGLDGNSGRT